MTSKEGMMYMLLIKENDKKYRRYAHEFAELFGIHLKPFWDNITGFDIVKFDDHIIQSPDGLSIKDVISKEYSNEAVELIEHLIGT